MSVEKIEFKSKHLFKNKIRIHIMSLFRTIKSQTSDDELNKMFVHHSIRYHDNEETGLTLLKYNQSKKKDYDFSNPLVSFSRGLVFHRETKKVVCLPPEKSLHIIPFSQSISKEQWLNEVLIEEFVDGTMINCFNFGGDWHISTRSFIGANCRWYSSRNFNELFDEAKGTLDFEKLNSSYCYTFVLRHPDNRIVAQYDSADLCLVQVREVLDDSYNDIPVITVQAQLKEFGVEVSVPERYSVESPEQINGLLSSMDFQKQGLVFKFNGTRSKVRNTEYEKVKFLRGNNKNIFYNYIELRKKGMVKEYLEYFPEYKDEFDGYRKEIEKSTMKLFNNYKEAYIYKKKTKQEIPFELRPLCYEMHGIYLSDHVKWDRMNVINYFNRMDIARMIFIVNFEKNKEFHLEKHKPYENSVNDEVSLSEN